MKSRMHCFSASNQTSGLEGRNRRLDLRGLSYELQPVALFGHEISFELRSGVPRDRARLSFRVPNLEEQPAGGRGIGVGRLEELAERFLIRA